MFKVKSIARDSNFGTFYINRWIQRPATWSAFTVCNMHKPPREQMYINTETLLLVCYPNIICPAIAAMVAGLPIYLEFKPISVHKILPNFQPNNPTLHRNMYSTVLLYHWHCENWDFGEFSCGKTLMKESQPELYKT